MWHGWTGWGDAIWMTVGMVAFWGLLIAVVVWTVGREPSERTGPRPPTAREILEERFARGEIDREGFEQGRAALSGSPTESKRGRERAS